MLLLALKNRCCRATYAPCLCKIFNLITGSTHAYTHGGMCKVLKAVSIVVRHVAGLVFDCTPAHPSFSLLSFRLSLTLHYLQVHTRTQGSLMWFFFPQGPPASFLFVYISYSQRFWIKFIWENEINTFIQEGFIKLAKIKCSVNQRTLKKCIVVSIY